MGLSNLERQVIGNLSIPRNVDDLGQHVLPYHAVNSADIDKLLRGDLSDRGLVVALGTHSDASKLASVVQRHKQTMELPDEKAEIYARRLTQRADLRWRLGGDLWMLSKEGLAAIKAPIDNAPPPMTLSQVQAAVNAEWSRVHHDEFIPGETSLASRLLPGEFAHWFDLVADACEKTWGERPKAPIAGGASGYSDAYEISILQQENQKVAIGAVVDPWFMALSILGLTDADTGTTLADGSHVPTYTGYARKSVAGTDMPTASGTGGSVSNTSAITFAACTVGTSTIIGFANTVDATTGAMRKWGDCTSTVVSTTQTPPQFAIGAYTTSVT